MKSLNLWIRISASTFFIAGLSLLSSCTSEITEEQLAKMKELRSSEQKLTANIKEKQDILKKLNAELSTRKSELKKCNEEADYVKSKLSSWPNVWPDWDPNAVK